MVPLPTSTMALVRVSIALTSCGLSWSTAWRHWSWAAGSLTVPLDSAAVGRVSCCSTAALACQAGPFIRSCQAAASPSGTYGTTWTVNRWSSAPISCWTCW